MLDRTEIRTRLHLWLTLLVALAVVAGVAATLIAGRVGLGELGAAMDNPIDGVLHVSSFSDAHLACPSDAAFSPDGAHIVVLGLLVASSPAATPASACPASADDNRDMASPDGNAPSSYAAGIFDSATGQVARVIPLDPLVITTLGVKTAGVASHLVYSGLGWSPDGARIAFAFTEFGASGRRTPENVIDSGLLLVDVASGAGDILRGDSGFFAMASGVSSGFPVWRLGKGTELPSFVPQPALAYAWGADGAPYPILPLRDTLDQLPPAAGPRYPVGIPDGGPRYTIWQPGLVIGALGRDMDASYSSFISAFPAWSPDGAHLTLLVAGVTLHNANGAAATDDTGAMRQGRGVGATPREPVPPDLPVVPARDAALAAVQQQVSDRGWAVVGWNPSGSLLGSIDCFTTRNQALEVRDTATGGVVATKPLDLASSDLGCRDTPDANEAGAYPSLGLGLAWSPEGDRLLVTDRAAGLLTLYHVRRQAAF